MIKGQISKSGAAALVAVLLIGGLIVELGIAGIFISYYFSQSGLGIKLSEEALAAARSGIQDAEIKIIRNKNFIPSPNPYTLTVGERTVQVDVCKDSCAGANKYQITALGMALTKRRQIQAIFYVDDNTGEVKLESEKETAL
ncbi:hypothetical protein COS61_00745 [Candidatus Wolfebacteria bacterium CG03_land_8_20_14_0_80_40_12]|uniref:Uncharacterized protein n=1 Tax=Candidatus Wolfebacteria bacterium CG03_land_8_20_14_0_80_40_12 TaxID=1975069 RepID=A0A2M7B640_9BACT|nr:MAG: hypothetical protein COS61_00745 [Candidatus Wolfebacteria bacterium CG03_land_8_20_14_0_80_40_12]